MNTKTQQKKLTKIIHELIRSSDAKPKALSQSEMENIRQRYIEEKLKEEIELYYQYLLSGGRLH